MVGNYVINGRCRKEHNKHPSPLISHLALICHCSKIRMTIHPSFPTITQVSLNSTLARSVGQLPGHHTMLCTLQACQMLRALGCNGMVACGWQTKQGLEVPVISMSRLQAQLQSHQSFPCIPRIKYPQGHQSLSLGEAFTRRAGLILDPVHFSCSIQAEKDSFIMAKSFKRQ